MDPLYQSVNPGQTKFYPTEYESMGCVKEVSSGETYDTRYTPSGIYTDVYNLRKDVAVLDTMYGLPKWHKYAPSDEELQSYKVGGWNRPTLSWSLQCEAEGKTREMAYKAAKTDLRHYTDTDKFRKCGIAFVTIFSFFFVTSGLVVFKVLKVPAKFYGHRIFPHLAYFILAPIVGVSVRDQFNIVSDNLDKVSNFDIFQGCADKYTQVS